MEPVEARRSRRDKVTLSAATNISLRWKKNLLYKLEAPSLPRYNPKRKLIEIKMQVALTFAPNLVPLTASRNISHVATFPPKVTASLSSKRASPIKLAAVTDDTSTVDYNSQISVFPAEACETIGGEACSADIYPEVKLQPQPKNDTPPIASENVEREYLEYNDAKTVFQGEACDDLGGIFCEREYQRGVY